VASSVLTTPSVEKNVGRNKLAQFRQPYGKRTAAMPELRMLVPAYGPLASRRLLQIEIFRSQCRFAAVLSATVQWVNSLHLTGVEQ